MSHICRYYTNDVETLGTIDAHQEFLASVTRIIKRNPPTVGTTTWSFQGFYTGPTSIAYLFYRLYQLYPELNVNGKSMHEWADAYLDLGIGAERRLRETTPSHCGIGNEELARLALTAVMREDSHPAKDLCSYAAIINSSADDGSNEWLYGRAGYLYLLRLCRWAFDEKGHHPSMVAQLNHAIKATVDRILAAPRPWRWHGTRYLGAAHGAVGIICQVVLSRPAAAAKLEPELAAPLDLRFESGNFPSSTPVGADRLVQFCHGGPGFVLSLRSLLPHFPRLGGAVGAAIAAAQEDIWRRGLLTKEPCLCHGIAGNALALGGDRQFAHFLSCMGRVLDAAHAESRPGEDRSSLFTGEAGRTWCWAVADTGARRTCIAYNDL
ncbi:hypothetical protein F4779DRAFT_642573 [Xylariaceae sp. FL0662B]|nr:hypothetical protein F4779DRAFT_642573 [Xylariaceae sp. FL0662B]